MRINGRRHFSTSLIAIWAITLLSCASGQKAEQGSGHVRQRIPVTVDAISKDEVKGKTFVFPDESKTDDVESIREYQFAKNALKEAGMTEADSPDSAHYQVTFQVESKKPVLGITIGAINPYTHTVSMTARHENKVAWQIKASGQTEFDKNGRFVSLLLGAAEEYIGENTNAPIRVQISTDDDRVDAIFNGQSAQESEQSPASEEQ